MRTFWKSLADWPPCVAAGPFLFFGGQMGRQPGNGSVCMGYEDVAGKGPERDTSFPWIESIEAPVAAQAVASYERIRKVLESQNGSLDDLVRLHLYQLDKRFFPVFDMVRRHYEPSSPAPSTAVGMSLFDPAGDVRLNIDGIAIRREGKGEARLCKTFGGSKEHKAAAHFSHVVAAGAFIFIAGQIPIDTSRLGAPLICNYDDVLPEGRFLQVGRSHEDSRNGPIASQTWFSYDLIRKHLDSVGASFADIVNLIVYLADMRDLPTFHRVHEHFFDSSPPALTVIEVGEVGHKGTLVEIEATALRPGFGLSRQTLESGDLPGALMSEGVRAGDLLFMSGIIGAAGDPVTLQISSILDRVARALTAAEASLESVAHITIFLKNIADFVQLEPILAKAFRKNRPALTVSEVPMPSPVADTSISLTPIAWLGPEPPLALADL